MKRKSILAILLSGIILASASTVSFAYTNGDIVDYVLYTDIVTSIDGTPVRSYNINGYTAIVAEDLESYGFDVTWDGGSRVLSAVRDASETASSDYTPEENTHKVGEKASPVYYTDIVTYLDGIKVSSYNVGGRTIIYVDDLAALYGESYVWDEDTRTLALTLSDSVNENAGLISGASAGQPAQSEDDTPPAQPGGDDSSKPEPPSGDRPGTPPDGEMGTPPSGQPGNPPEGGMGTPPGGSGFGSDASDSGTAANTIDSDGSYTGSYTSTGDDENALLIDGAAVTLDGITVSKSAGASSNTESGDFYGVNAALLAKNGATVTITGSEITSSAQNGNGVFSYGSGTTVNISDSTITTTADNSGGIQTTGGGTTNASNLTVTTSGSSSAAIRSDRGGGTVNVDGGTYTSNGYNSPAVYSTADITIKNAVLTANNSEALVIEGKNSITLENCEVSGNMSDTKGSSSDINVHNVMIYQSMSGDADIGQSSFSMSGGTLTSENGDMIYVTNTDCTVYLSGVTIINKDKGGVFLRIVGNDASHGWGTAGKNGGSADVTADGQIIEGDIVVDSISTLDLTLKNGSVLTGAVNIIENAEGGSAVSDNADIVIESGCTWNLTADCVISTLTNNGTVNFNGYTITLADGTVLK